MNAQVNSKISITGACAGLGCGRRWINVEVKRRLLFIASVLALMFALSQVAFAQEESCQTCKPVTVGFQASVCSANAVTISFAGSTAIAGGTCNVDQWMTTDQTFVELRPDETSTL